MSLKPEPTRVELQTLPCSMGGLTHKQQTSLEKLERLKHSCGLYHKTFLCLCCCRLLFTGFNKQTSFKCYRINYSCNKFYDKGPRVQYSELKFAQMKHPMGLLSRDRLKAAIANIRLGWKLTGQQWKTHYLTNTAVFTSAEKF